VILKAYAYVDTADWPDEGAEVEEGQEPPELGINDAIAAFEESLLDDEEALESFVQTALDRGDFEVTVNT